MRPRATAFVFSYGLALIWIVSAAATVPAQSPAVPKAVSATDVAPFLGDWLVPLGGDEMMLGIAVDAGQVRAEIKQPHQVITDISKSGDSLLLKLGFMRQGTPTPMTITLTPAATPDALKVTVELTITMTGTAAHPMH